MVRAARLLPDGQGAFVERLGLGVVALGVVRPCQVVQAVGHTWGVCADVRVCRFKGFTGDDNGSVVFALPVKFHDLPIKNRL